jgi:hypothetical protein
LIEVVRMLDQFSNDHLRLYAIQLPRTSICCGARGGRMRADFGVGTANWRWSFRRTFL